MAGFWGVVGLGVEDKGPVAPGEVGLLALYTNAESFLRESDAFSPLFRLPREDSEPPFTFVERADPPPNPYGSLALLFLGGGGGGTFFPLSDAPEEESSLSEGEGLLGKGMLLTAGRVLVGDRAW